ncbi:hypothetical protein [Pseudomonas caspiana]|uniref:Lipoprotein n=1 Tax=Pseudomonas caspiana TaxID=1451454 RepID=A0A1Y3P2H1_9PSED|nr:hypothetical protein [Pseudomonas caspiana]OUM74027.1 hypothetical protein AUC60_09370 [Pseudomonas caspiana]
MLTPRFRFFRAFATLALLPAVLAGCSFHGTYPDATAPDAARLRFVANTENATLDYFDGEHCTGQNTGLLNNLFSRDTDRRVGMSFAPPADAKGYLEVKLAPGKEAYLRVNTLGSYSVCGASFNVIPEANAEYELTFKSIGRQCSTLLEQVKSVGGKVVRTPVMLEDKGLPACDGSGPLFPKAFAQTPLRAQLIEQIMDNATPAAMKDDPAYAKRPPVGEQKLDEMIAERKARLGFIMPDDYWTLYRANLVAFQDETISNGPKALQRYDSEYRRRLQYVNDQQLEMWAEPQDKSGRPANAAANAQYTSMLTYYLKSQRALMVEAINHHLERMAKMDEQYGVCKRFPDCWKQ